MEVIHIPSRKLLLQHMVLIYRNVCAIVDLVKTAQSVEEIEGTEGGLTHAAVAPSSTLPFDTELNPQDPLPRSLYQSPPCRQDK